MVDNLVTSRSIDNVLKISRYFSMKFANCMTVLILIISIANISQKPTNSNMKSNFLRKPTIMTNLVTSGSPL